MASDIANLLQQIGVENFPYYEFHRRARGHAAVSRWALLAETDRALRQLQSELAREEALREAEGLDVPSHDEPTTRESRPRRLALLGQVRRFSDGCRSCWCSPAFGGRAA